MRPTVTKINIPQTKTHSQRADEIDNDYKQVQSVLSTATSIMDQAMPAIQERQEIKRLGNDMSIAESVRDMGDNTLNSLNRDNKHLQVPGTDSNIPNFKNESIFKENYRTRPINTFGFKRSTLNRG